MPEDLKFVREAEREVREARKNKRGGRRSTTAAGEKGCRGTKMKIAIVST
jgi:hypothetical protein